MDDSSVATLELSELFADDILAFLSDIEVEPTNHTHQNSIVGGAEPGPSNPYNGVRGAHHSFAGRKRGNYLSARDKSNTIATTDKTFKMDYF